MALPLLPSRGVRDALSHEQFGLFFVRTIPAWLREEFQGGVWKLRLEIAGAGRNRSFR